MGVIINDGRDPKPLHADSTSSEYDARAQLDSSSTRATALDYRIPYTHELFQTYPHMREFFCGGTAAAINIVITFPPNKIMFRQQVRHCIAFLSLVRLTSID